MNKNDKKLAKHCINNYYKRKKQYEIMTKKQREEEQRTHIRHGNGDVPSMCRTILQRGSISNRKRQNQR